MNWTYSADGGFVQGSNEAEIKADPQKLARERDVILAYKGQLASNIFLQKRNQYTNLTLWKQDYKDKFHRYKSYTEKTRQMSHFFIFLNV